MLFSKEINVIWGYVEENTKKRLKLVKKITVFVSSPPRHPET